MGLDCAHVRIQVLTDLVVAVYLFTWGETTAMNNTRCKPLPAANFHRLRFLSVIGGFLDGQTLEFSSGLNCLIGARGTGKTTALELIR